VAYCVGNLCTSYNNINLIRIEKDAQFYVQSVVKLLEFKYTWGPLSKIH